MPSFETQPTTNNQETSRERQKNSREAKRSAEKPEQPPNYEVIMRSILSSIDKLSASEKLSPELNQRLRNRVNAVFEKFLDKHNLVKPSFVKSPPTTIDAEVTSPEQVQAESKRQKTEDSPNSEQRSYESTIPLRLEKLRNEDTSRMTDTDKANWQKNIWHLEILEAQAGKGQKEFVDNWKQVTDTIDENLLRSTTIEKYGNNLRGKIAYGLKKFTLKVFPNFFPPSHALITTTVPKEVIKKSHDRRRRFFKDSRDGSIHKPGTIYKGSHNQEPAKERLRQAKAEGKFDEIFSSSKNLWTYISSLSYEDADFFLGYVDQDPAFTNKLIEAMKKNKLDLRPIINILSQTKNEKIRQAARVIREQAFNALIGKRHEIIMRKPDESTLQYLIRINKAGIR